jgi:hypothetical protein
VRYSDTYFKFKTHVPFLVANSSTMVKCNIFFLCLICSHILCQAQPVFRNPGLPDSESFEIYELVDPTIGRVITKINVTTNGQNHSKFYAVDVNEGGLFANEIEIRYDDLTTISEKRTDLGTGKIIQSYKKTGDTVHFYNAEKGINKIFITSESNIYSPLAYYFSFRGFPFEVGKSVSFKSYMYQYGGVLTMNLSNTSKQTVTVKAGTFECYVLELSVGGWQSLFTSDKYYLYFTVADPHIFVKYEEKINGSWIADELMRYGK